MVYGVYITPEVRGEQFIKKPIELRKPEKK
jgi:hypothetical protein